jgi:hypothetical protein
VTLRGSHETYANAAEVRHDDLVVATCLSVFGAERLGPRFITRYAVSASDPAGRFQAKVGNGTRTPQPGQNTGRSISYVV